MSVRVMSWVWERSPASGAELLVLLAIADNASDDGGNAWPAVATLARKCRMSARTVQRSIRRLQVEGLLDVDEQGGRGGSNLYRVLMDTPRQSVTPPVKLAPRQSGTGDTDVTGGMTPVSPEPSLNRPPTPQPPASGGPDDGTDHCPRHVRHRQTCPHCVAAAEALRARPAWCGRCDPDKRMREDDDARPYRCPDCHPLAERKPA